MKKRTNADIFFDTDILIHAVTDFDRRHAIAQARLAEGGTISVQVLNEFVNVARRKLKLDWPELDAALSVIRALCGPPRPVLLTTHERALGIARGSGFAIFNSLIIAAALEAGCKTLLSEDLQHGQVIEDRLTIRNPFLD